MSPATAAAAGASAQRCTGMTNWPNTIECFGSDDFFNLLASSLLLLMSLVLGPWFVANCCLLSGKKTFINGYLSNVHQDLIKAMLHARAFINAKDTSGKYPLHMLCANEKVPCVTKLLEARASCNSACEHGVAPLHEVCRIVGRIQTSVCKSELPADTTEQPRRRDTT